MDTRTTYQAQITRFLLHSLSVYPRAGSGIDGGLGAGLSGGLGICRSKQRLVYKFHSGGIAVQFADWPGLPVRPRSRALRRVGLRQHLHPPRNLEELPIKLGLVLDDEGLERIDDESRLYKPSLVRLPVQQHGEGHAAVAWRVPQCVDLSRGEALRPMMLYMGASLI